MPRIWLATLLLLVACGNLDSVKEQCLKAVKDAKPDEAIVANLKKYEDLHQFVKNRLNDLLLDQKRNHQSGSPHGDHVFEKTSDSSIFCYSFDPQTQEKDSIETKENLTMMELKSQVKSLGKIAPTRIEICSNGQISLTVKIHEDFEKFNDFYLEHILIWDVDRDKSNKYWNDAYKDKNIHENVTYRIGAVFTG